MDFRQLANGVFQWVGQFQLHLFGGGFFLLLFLFGGFFRRFVGFLGRVLNRVNPETGLPLIERVVTVTGPGVNKPQNLIVPVGAKGGFVARRLDPAMSREEVQKEGIECYKQFIRGLLDITDNRGDVGVVRPSHVVCKDEEDPYLVVAADKGTATFSDTANGVANEHGHWLGDAFASGGSVGYDHKAMGITARGAWEAVKHHFREIGVNTQKESFTVVGIGDMSGDVFGNGMLLSDQIKLVGAFNHLHVFLDPDPDAARSYAERRRLFELPRSSWSDYDETRLSPGGAIFDRRAKALTVSPEAKELLGLSSDTMTPDELVRSIEERTQIYAERVEAIAGY